MARRSNVPKNYQLIWDAVSQIPLGKVTTYGEVAQLAGLPGQARLVGYALHNLPHNTKVPWHRVINAEGRISLSNLDGLRDLQVKLLRKERVLFIKERTSFSKYGWLQNLTKQSRRRV
ncbi:MAG: methylated-DNA--[protein]-cysteine S-methyltransferase [Ignavibacteria bacterium]|nr:methylated-DNA--[protein]-cysteine S-methyltransferase [Ignavibacteria bacterium]MBI3766284.1 methylated-DNA--[protein]-cysteine S-methyltransferase [Ignavibacteriales bacterium]